LNDLPSEGLLSKQLLRKFLPDSWKPCVSDDRSKLTFSFW
jgi:hypothetical protein